MTVGPYKVVIVVDRNFGKQLEAVEQNIPVWIVNTPVNAPVIQRVWKMRGVGDHLTSVTSFQDTVSLSPEDLLISHLNTIDLHHGVHSADPPYTVLEVVGVPLSEKIKTALLEYGFSEFRSDVKGFVALRPAPRD